MPGGRALPGSEHRDDVAPAKGSRGGWPFIPASHSTCPDRASARGTPMGARFQMAGPACATRPWPPPVPYSAS